jgi:hypothetical protein
MVAVKDVTAATLDVAHDIPEMLHKNGMFDGDVNLIRL